MWKGSLQLRVPVVGAESNLPASGPENASPTAAAARSPAGRGSDRDRAEPPLSRGPCARAVIVTPREVNENNGQYLDC
ncbi:Protein of unknown function [Gryllus bimaculatus]|nr:Protein of unknown function [Gryllus bimaculatus]